MTDEITDFLLEQATDADQYLTFMLADEEYGIDILRIQEVQVWSSVTVLPNSPEFVLGVINLRGAVIPVVDLRRRFNLETVPVGNKTVVIVVKIPSDGSTRTVGLVVDAVSDVYSIVNDQVQSVMHVGGEVCEELVKGVATVDDHMVILLDVAHLMDKDVIGALEAARQVREGLDKEVIGVHQAAAQKREGSSGEPVLTTQQANSD